MAESGAAAPSCDRSSAETTPSRVNAFSLGTPSRVNVRCSSETFTVFVEKILLTGAVKPKYKVQGCLSVRGEYAEASTTLKCMQGLPLRWLPEEGDIGLLRFEINNTTRKTRDLCFRLQRKDGVFNQTEEYVFTIDLYRLRKTRRTDEQIESFQLKTGVFNKQVNARLFCTSYIQDWQKFEILAGEFSLMGSEFVPEQEVQVAPPPYPGVLEVPYIQATHSLLLHGRAKYQVQILHCEEHPMSVVKVCSRGDVLARAHLVGQAQLNGIRCHYRPQDRTYVNLTLNQAVRERAMLIEGGGGNWAILKAARQPSMSGFDMLDVVHYDFNTTKWTNFPRRDAHSSIDLGLARIVPYLGYITLPDDCAHVPETLALCFGLTILFILCIPRPVRVDWKDVLYIAAGYGKMIPPDDCEPDPRFLTKLQRAEMELSSPADPDLPAYGPDLVSL